MNKQARAKLMTDVLVYLKSGYGIEHVGTVRNCPVVADCWPHKAAYYSVGDNGGEIHVHELNSSKPGESVPYDTFNGEMDAVTMAYRVACIMARANLAGAKHDPASPEEIARLDAVREIVLAKPERLQMDHWHSHNWTPEHTPEEEHACGSAHCIAGWLQALSPDRAIREMCAEDAGRKLAPTFSFMFYTSDAVALQWLEDRAYAKAA